MDKKAIVIGGGIGGLALSIRLINMGFSVELIEKNDYLGGKMAEISASGFRFDTGPSLFTLPELVDELFTLSHKNARDYFSYTKLDRTCRYCFNDGTVVDAWSDQNKFAGEVETVLGEPSGNLENYLKKYGRLYNIAAPVFIFNAFQRLKNLTRKSVLRAFAHLPQLDAFTSMHTRNSKAFRSPKLVQMFDRFATYNGSDPYRAPATLNMISHLEYTLGAYYPVNGMRSIITSLEKLAVELGVNITLNRTVDRILIEHNKVTGIIAGEKELTADTIICDLDARSVYARLLPAIKPPKSIINKELSSSAVIFYWGVNKTSDLEVHNILFAEDYQAEFNAIFKSKTLYHDPTVYIFISKKMVATDAPHACENWYVMMNVSAETNQNQKALRKEARKLILAKIKKVLRLDLAEHIVFEAAADPFTIESKTASFKGALYGNSSNSMFAAFNRHTNFSRQFKNLWFVGGSVHPGGGIPLCLASAKIVAEEINKEVPYKENNS